MRCPNCGYEIKQKKLEVEQEKAFERWWGHYPKKVAKKKAFDIWLKIDPSQGLIDQMMRTLHWQTGLLWDDYRFIPNPTTYLNQGRYEDEPPQDIKDILKREERGPMLYPVRHEGN